ncbi:MAG: deoxyribodipyrimidine photo-lyase, partial [Actinomycetota bacterium]
MPDEAFGPRDHPALHDAARAGEVVPLFVLDERLLGTSRNRARFLLEGLRDLDGDRRGVAAADDEPSAGRRERA